MIAFIILHYKNLNDTLECIDSIKKTKGSKKIIVVDNHSLLDKDKLILEKKVDNLLCLDENLGFAKANNLGCKLAIDQYHPDFLAVLNNDTIINQTDFITRIKGIYERTSFDLLGPKILCQEGSGSVNPYRPLKTKNEVQAEIKYQQKILKYYNSIFLFFLLQCYLKIKHFLKKYPIPRNGEVEEQNVGLHGCAIIFSEKYYKHYQDIFYNETFLYHEEDLLYLRMKKDKLISIYNPELKIIHKEGASLNTEFSGNLRKKLIFRTTEVLKSLRLLEGEMEKQ